MNKQERKALIAYHLQQIRDGNKEYKVYPPIQDRPNTCVVLRYNGKVYPGFSKACWPDQWSPVRGVMLALDKAVAKLVKDNE